MHSFYLPPGNLDVVAVTGPDAAKFLQGQLTCDVDALADPGVTRGALCNNKGRVLAIFELVRHDSAFLVVLNKGLGAVFMLALKKYLPFYKCEMRPADGMASGVIGDASAAVLAPEGPPHAMQCKALKDGWICNLDTSRQLYLLYGASGNQALPGVRAGTLDDWLVGGIPAGRYPFGVEDSEKYTPQELHLDRHGYVSFTKGCYTGQEIVARLHYRGKLKKVLFVLEAPAGNISPSEPMEILDANEAIMGASFKILSSEGMQYVLAPLPAEFENNPPTAVKNRAGLRFTLRVF